MGLKWHFKFFFLKICQIVSPMPVRSRASAAQTRSLDQTRGLARSDSWCYVFKIISDRGFKEVFLKKKEKKTSVNLTFSSQKL